MGIQTGRVFRLMASYFFLRGQEKVTKKKATPLRRPSGSRAETRERALHQLALAGRKQRDPLRSSNTVPLFPRPHAPTRQLSKGKPGVNQRAAEFSIIARGCQWCVLWVPF